jgi:hypothetical protein
VCSVECAVWSVMCYVWSAVGVRAMAYNIGHMAQGCEGICHM